MDKVCRPIVVWESEQHIALKHHAHITYMGRMSGSANCEAYVALYSRNQLEDWRELAYGGKPLKVWKGHESRSFKKIINDIKAMGF